MAFRRKCQGCDRDPDGGPFIRVPRMTTRRWMIVVSASAALATLHLHLGRHRLAAAQHAERVYRQFYDEGRVTAYRYFEVSEELLNARLSLVADGAERDVAVVDHLT